MAQVSDQRTTFFTCANRAYELYVLPYITSVLVHNDDARVEVCLESSNRFAEHNTEALDVLEHGFGGRFHLRNASTSSASASPNSVRFLEVPDVMLPYTYIGDIDVLCLETVSEQHIRRMDHTGLPYSNVLRPGKTALSGLHFTRSEAFYPQSLPADADLQRDEYLLYQLVVSRGCALPDPDDRWRPLHGYHMSLNRAPLSAPGKGPGWRAKVAYRRPIWDPRRWRRATIGLLAGESLAGSGRRFEAYKRLRRNEVWQEVGKHFDHRYVSMLGLLDLALAAQVSKDCRKRGFTPDYGLSLLADRRLVQQITHPQTLGD